MRPVIPLFKHCALVLVFSLPVTGLLAQTGFSIGDIANPSVIASGTIMGQNEVHGYYLFYLDHKIDKHSDIYTLQILDDSLNRVRAVQFEGSGEVAVMESACNGDSYSFLFKDDNRRQLTMQIYGLDGILRYTYSREFSRKTAALWGMNGQEHADVGTNNMVFPIGDSGYVSVLPLRAEGYATYEMRYYGSNNRQEWTFTPDTTKTVIVSTQYMGCTDSLIILKVTRSRSGSYGKSGLSVHLEAINFVTRKKQFDLDGGESDYRTVPLSMVSLDSGRLLVLAEYYDLSQNIVKNFSLGLAFYTISTTGQVLRKVYNSWAEDIARYLPVNKKGKTGNLGYIYIHRLIRTPDNRLFVVGEGYKRQASGAGIAMKTLGLLMGEYTDQGVTQIIVTDLVILKFSNQCKAVDATVYEKSKYVGYNDNMSDFAKLHMLGAVLEQAGAFDYTFTLQDASDSTFEICYRNRERNGADWQRTFNDTWYVGGALITDKFDLAPNVVNVLPGAGGTVMIAEYFSREKRLGFRLKKLG
ncbi:MAG TPA: DUF6770 family protein [Puia sp.]|nr:DUF6770 family protein [Puia sp.]